ncbi:hypothetical protein [Sporichthya sp.]|uniref:hypothetical protein n=1 Tax=Sporichthya sp. TaxID=65475 RepID=UPI00183CB4B3|nr:hypothetical protein [Sporichthya sp.]MBA3742312.1 hypothetical protein [Sporichthya sp.]
MAVIDPVAYAYTADERHAYALCGVFKVLSTLCAAVAIVAGALLALDIVAFLVIAGIGLFIAALLLFLGHVLALLAGIHARLGAIRDASLKHCPTFRAISGQFGRITDNVTAAPGGAAADQPGG